MNAFSGLQILSVWSGVMTSSSPYCKMTSKGGRWGKKPASKWLPVGSIAPVLIKSTVNEKLLIYQWLRVVKAPCGVLILLPHTILHWWALPHWAGLWSFIRVIKGIILILIYLLWFFSVSFMMCMCVHMYLCVFVCVWMCIYVCVCLCVLVS